MEVNRELSEKLKRKRYLWPDGRVMTVSHVIETDGPGGPYYRAVYNVDEPEIGSTGVGSCSLTYIESLVEIGNDLNKTGT